MHCLITALCSPGKDKRAHSSGWAILPYLAISKQSNEMQRKNIILARVPQSV